MNGQPGGDASNQATQEAQLAYLLSAAGQGGAGGLMGAFPGAAAAMAGAGRLGLSDSAIEEQILQRASALRAEALMQQQQQQRQHQLGTALAALQQQQSLQQQQQLSALAGLNPGMGGLGVQEQEALFARAAALRELGALGGAPGGLPGGMDRLQQLELNRLEEAEMRRRQQLAALANLSGGGARPEGAVQSAAELGQESIRSASSETERAPAAATPAPVPSEKSKEDLRKTPGTVIVPCRARGMPMDHNFKTAYFVISEDAKHGEDLVCSYFACRNGGVKFRYCAYCMAPVAKRNFCRRHDHGMSKLKDGKVPDDDGNQSDSTSGSKKGSEEIMAAAPLQGLGALEKAKTQAPLDLLTSTATSQFLDSSDKKRKMPADEAKSGEEDTADAAADSSAIEGEGSQGLRSISAKRRKLWTELLVRRPRSKDPRHLSAWLNEVLTVSEFEIPLDQIKLMQVQVEEPAAASASSDEEKKEKKDKKDKAKEKSKEKTKEPAKPKEPKKPKEKSKSEEEPKAKKAKTTEKEPSSSGSSSSSDEKPKEEEKKPSEPKEKSPKKSLSPKKEDDFAGSFADWRDRKKGKALKKGTGSLRK